MSISIDGENLAYCSDSLLNRALNDIQDELAKRQAKIIIEKAIKEPTE